MLNVEGKAEELSRSFQDLKDKMLEDQKDQIEFQKLFMKFMKKKGSNASGEDEEEGSEYEETPERRREYEEDAHLVAKRVELLSFNGNDPRGWRTRAETY
ncbi:MAG: hypothetical protein Q8877_02535 [Sweet potato little leaf phytoplasma]|nr:hypothetical protein [Sweet potato little leaf phytoplasma]